MDFATNFNSPGNITKDMLDQEILKFTLSLYNNALLSRKGVDFVIQQFETFISKLMIPFIVSQMESQVKPVANIASYSKVLYILENNKQLFGKFSTEHLRFKLYEQESYYIPPQLFEIGEDSVFLTDGQGGTKVGKKTIYAAHVPLKLTLEAFFKVPGMFNQMQGYADSLSRDKTMISNFIQGDLWSKKYKTSEKLIFPLFVYFDEFETGNALGSHSGEEKLGGVYVSLACLPPHLVAKVKNIFVSTICHAKYLKKFGNERIFRKVIEDFNVLSDEGIIVTVNGQDRIVYFECVLVLGDNLGLNCICGFSESFTANRFCRFCSATIAQCQELAVEDETLVRTINTYESDVLKNDLYGTGIKERCVFNNIKKFHIAENKCVDVDHDVGEGIAAYTISKVVESLVKTNVITLEIINNRIDSFPYNETEKSNKPRPLFFRTGKKGGSEVAFRQSASESLCLTRYLGLMIGDLVPAENKYWKLYLCLRKIVGLLTSPQLNRGQIENVGILIQKHNRLYLKLFGKLKPKMHIWLHYPHIMLLNGPVVHFSTMKYERENRKLKEVALGTTSSTHLPKTIAIRHQLQFAYNLQCCPMLEGDVVIGPIENANAHENMKKLVPQIQIDTPVSSLKYIEILGKRFSARTVFVSRIETEGIRFGLVKKILLFNNNVYFHAKEFDTICFNHSYHAYHVHSNSNKPDLLINIELLPKTPPCLLITKNKDEFVATRYDI